MDAHLPDIADVIRLSVASVFLLTAISPLIGAMNTRPGRIEDCRRVVGERSPRAGATAEAPEELERLARLVADFFIFATASMIAALSLLLREIHLAVSGEGLLAAPTGQDNLAGPVRFELTMPFGTPVFKTGAFNRSATAPAARIIP